MSAGGEDPLEAILKAQNSAWNPLPKLVHRAALPAIAPKTTPSFVARNDSIDISRPATATISRPPTTVTTIGFPSLPKLGTVPKPMETITEKPKTPIYPIPRTNIAYNLNLHEIDNDEILRPDSTGSTVIESERDDVTKKVISLPETFSEFRELSVDLDQISVEEIDKMRHNCASSDVRNTGFLPLNSVLTSIKSCLQNPSDTWQHLLDWLMANGFEDEKDSDLVFVLDYDHFFRVLQNDKQSREVLANIPEVLDSNDAASVFSRLPSRPTSSQAQRERWRVKLLMDLEIILATNPEIDIERFKLATDKKMISIDELHVLLQIYGLAEHVQHLEQRIIDCFLTHDNFFCFSAFVGCLNQINPAVLRLQKTPSPPVQKSAPWSKPPLPKLDDSGLIRDFSPSGS